MPELMRVFRCSLILGNFTKKNIFCIFHYKFTFLALSSKTSVWSENLHNWHIKLCLFLSYKLYFLDCREKIIRSKNDAEVLLKLNQFGYFVYVHFSNWIYSHFIFRYVIPVPIPKFLDIEYRKLWYIVTRHTCISYNNAYLFLLQMRIYLNVYYSR